MVKKQQMRWSQRGAHLLLQIRTRVLNGDWEDVFEHTPLSQVVSGIPCLHAARVRVSLAASPIFVQSASVRHPWCASLI
jgi:hypothetical protein